jgi:hypothetical protein
VIAIGLPIHNTIVLLDTSGVNLFAVNFTVAIRVTKGA